jgi:hypothetical protein
MKDGHKTINGRQRHNLGQRAFLRGFWIKEIISAQAGSLLKENQKPENSKKLGRMWRLISGSKLM